MSLTNYLQVSLHLARWPLRAARILACSGVLLLLVGCGRETGEPTEAEMRQAVQDRIDMVNENIAKMRNTRPDENNPIASLMALAGAAMGDTKYFIRDFQKLGAEKAQGRPGYMCDYLLQLRATGRTAGAMDTIMKWGGSLNTARFVKNGDRWVWIVPSDEE